MMHNHKGRCPLLFLVLQIYKIKTADKVAFCIKWITQCKLTAFLNQ